MRCIVLVAVCLIAAAWAKDLHLKSWGERVREIVQKVNSMDAGWKAHPHFENIGEHHVKAMLGVLPGGPQLPIKEHDNVNAAAIPDEFDSRTNWPKCPTIGAVRDQDGCGSCWAHGAVEAISDRICITTNGQKILNISAFDMMSCCRTCGSGCQGGYPSAAWQYWRTTGVATGGLYGDTQSCMPYPFPHCMHFQLPGPYPPCPQNYHPTPACPGRCTVSTYPTPYQGDKHRGSSAYRVSARVEQIQTEIMTHGPVEVTFTVYEDFPTYKSGVYRHTTSRTMGGHAVKMIGWGVENGTPYWLCVNSWNEGWGDKGYFKILRGHNEAGIESSVDAGLP